jgi:kynurenine formamidase
MTVVHDLIESLSAGTVEVIELTQPLSEQTPLLQLPEPLANTPGLTRHQISRFDERGPNWAWDWLEIGEHVGTHFDAPIHWITGREGEDVASAPPSRLVAPVSVIDKSGQAREDSDCLLTVEDVTDFEARHGELRPGSWLFLRTGWAGRAHDQGEFLNAGEDGPHYPGPDAECSRWLAQERPIVGLGVETVGIDAGIAHRFEPAFPAHHYLLGAGKYGLTQLANLDRLPPTGALALVAPLRLVGGTGSPTRVLALVSARARA